MHAATYPLPAPGTAVTLVRHLLRAFLLLIALGAGLALAAIPQVLNYQGYLTNSASQPIEAPAATPLKMTFKLYTAGGVVALYTELQDVIVKAGVFNVQIGTVTPLTLPFDVPYFLEISIGPGQTPEVLSPRQPLASSAYALRSGCIPGDRMSCFTFANGAPGVGPCQAGVRVCNAAGTGYGSCVGEVGPNCGSVCANLQTDSNNCGMCGIICPLGESCGGTGSPGVCGANTCGNGMTTGAEGCDDGNIFNGDGCSSTCQVEAGFQCFGTPSACSLIVVCGDGMTTGAESCDDGNIFNGDGCSSTCQVEAGFQCFGMPSICTPI